MTEKVRNRNSPEGRGGGKGKKNGPWVPPNPIDSNKKKIHQ
jgi:hypothetical protein